MVALFGNYHLCGTPSKIGEFLAILCLLLLPLLTFLKVAGTSIQLQHLYFDRTSFENGFGFVFYEKTSKIFEFKISSMSIAQIDGMQKCCPVLIEKNSSHNILTPHCSESSVARIICGSWSSDFDYKPLNEEISLVKDKIEDAMKESNEKVRGKQFILLFIVC